MNALIKRTLPALLCLWFSSVQAAELGSLMDQAVQATSGSVTALLGQQFDAEPTQIEGGIGSVLALAQNKLKSGEFDQLLGAVPGAQGYLDTAKQLGLLDLPLESVDSVVSALGGIGWSPAAAADFVPAAISALGNVGGPQVQQLLGGLLAAG
jgi:hypothetical protein